ncbi:unnamed protein product [Blepharisma stoltei]|uniref:Uncharacterized protein n=1 Tax=Blepharisma stoltei TaxID=1481888 RepID=A0AAU9IQQ4_9CILI|nr:unnamed protein product [Blepharisma stoltei]
MGKKQKPRTPSTSSSQSESALQNPTSNHISLASPIKTSVSLSYRDSTLQPLNSDAFDHISLALPIKSPTSLRQSDTIPQPPQIYTSNTNSLVCNPDPLSIIESKVSDSLRQMFELYFAEFTNSLSQKTDISNSEYFKFDQRLDIRHNPSLKRGEEFESLYQIYYDNANNFSDKLLTHLKKYDDPDLITVLIGIDKANKVFMRASREVKDAMQRYYKKNFTTFEEVNRVLFFHRVLSPLEEKIQSAREFVNQCEAARRACQLYDEESLHLNMLSEASSPNNRTKFKRNKQIVRWEEMSVDEIVNFINGDETPKKNKAKNRSQSNGKQRKEVEIEIDEEIEEFQKRIEEVSLSSSRFKPKVTQEWLSNLRKEIKMLSLFKA